MKIVRSLEKSDSLVKVVTGTMKKRKRTKKSGFLGLLLGIVGANVFRKFINWSRSKKS